MSELFDLTGQVAIVTGTSRGLGQYFARALARAGADLVLTSRDHKSLAPFEAEISALGRRFVSLDLDVRNRESIEKMVAAAREAFGRLDILVNNAGCNVRKPALDVTWDRLESHPGHQSAWQLFRCASRRTVHGHPQLRTYHQHWIGDQRRRLRGPGPIWREPRWNSSAHHELGGRLGKARHNGQLPRARMVSHRAERGAIREYRVG